MYRLTKEELIDSVYYCAAGIDLQPLLRLGDISSNFIYVSIGLKKQELLDGLNDYINNLNKFYDEQILKINSVVEIDISDIEHPKQNQLIIRVPEYMGSYDFRNYLDVFNSVRKNAEHYYLMFTFTLKLGNYEKTINVYYLTGEALATYEAIYSNQEIAPKVFISIQSGLIEKPERYTNRMFESHKVLPKVWIRGVWSSAEDLSDNLKSGVFVPYGIFNKEIGKFINWDSQMDVLIDGTTNELNSLRLVRAYGQSEFWHINPKHEILYESKGILIRKVFARFEDRLSKNYSIGVHPNLINELDNLNINIRLNYLDKVYEEYKYFSKKYQQDENYKRAIMPYAFEAQEGYINEFVEKFIKVNNTHLTIDIYYINELDFKRDF